jgi:serine/threonine-protein kinase
MLQQVLAIQEKVYGKVHPRVASTLNELGRIAQQEAQVDDAEADFSRMAEIYRTVYAGKHYYIGVALCNLAGVYVEKKQYNRAVALFREGLRIYGEPLSRTTRTSESPAFD